MKKPALRRVLFILVGLSEADTNKYRTLLKEKSLSVSDNPVARPATDKIISQETQNDNSKNGYYAGKKVVKQLQQSYRRSFTPEETQKIIDAYQSGKSSQELGTEFRCCKTTILKLLRRQGVETRKGKGVAKIDDEAVIRMYKQMFTIKQIAKCYEVDPQTISKCLKRHGIKMRTRWDYPEEK